MTASGNELAAAFREWINSDRAFTDHGKAVDNRPMLDTKRGAMIAHLEELCGGEEPRRLLLKYLFNIETSHDLTCFQQNALYLWLAPRKDDVSGKWIVSNPKAHNTAQAVVRAVRVVSGQLELRPATAADYQRAIEEGYEVAAGLLRKR